MRIMLADSVYVLHEGDPDCSIRYEIGVPEGVPFQRDEFLKAFREWLGKNRKGLHLWDTHEWRVNAQQGQNQPLRWMLVIELPFRHVVPNRVVTHYIALLGSKWMGPRVDWTSVTQLADEAFGMVWEWFTWLYSQREERQRCLEKLSLASPQDEQKDLNERLIETLQWPVPFQDLIGFLQAA
jgi:hypothetical protein